MAMNKGAWLNLDRQLSNNIQSWLDEDIGNGDVTSMSMISPDQTAEAVIHAKQSGVIAGLPVAAQVFAEVDADLQVEPQVQEGAEVETGTILMRVSGRTRSLLTGERLALNLLQRMSGIATKTRRYVRQAEGYPVRIVDTRKTTPGHRLLEKYAVRIGGGHNHRFGLDDAVMIKDNHIKSAGSVRQAVEAARANIPHTMKIEVEVEQYDQLQEAIAARADIIMLDNMSLQAMREAVHMIKSALPDAIVEASGGMTEERIREVADTGVDVISIGGLTSSVSGLDISLDLYDKKGSAR